MQNERLKCRFELAASNDSVESHAVQAVGMPEVAVVLAQLVAFLARAPKSTAVYKAYKRAAEAVHSEPNAPPPLCICNAPTQMMKELGYGAGYIYPPDCGYPVRPQGYLPESLKEQVFFDDTDRATANATPGGCLNQRAT